MIIEQVKTYLEAAREGKSRMDEELIQEFGEKCKSILRERFQVQDEKKKGPLRMSNVGAPLCKIQMAASGEKEGPAWNGYAHEFQMLTGDVIEAAAIAVMKAAKVPVEKVNEPVELDIDGFKLKGTYDVKIDNVIYDIKSTSPYSFKYKFNNFDGLASDDPFGYIEQGVLYGEADNSRFGGWIVIDKSSGEWKLLETPRNYDENRKRVIRRTQEVLRSIRDNKPFERCFTAEEETFRGKKTGNKFLGVTCKFCPYKEPCWKDANLTLAPNPRSKAKEPERNYYVGEIK